MWIKKFKFIIVLCFILFNCFILESDNIFLSIDKVRGSGTIWHVGSGGDFETIQAAIDAASSEDTIFVSNGIYTESILINTNNLTLIGNCSQDTIITSESSHVVTINAEIVTISNFTIHHKGIQHYGISISGDDCNISNCNIIGNFGDSLNYGVYLTQGIGNRLCNNTIFNSYYGMYIRSGSNNNSFSNNIILNASRYGFYLYFANDNIFTNNIISNSTHYGFSTGMFFQQANGNEIKNNTYNNNSNGIIIRDQSQGNIIKNNTIANNTQYGIWIYGESENNSIYHNNIINNDQNANDSCTNYWDNNYPSGGNYWSDYGSSDNDGDGIGDNPYSIPGGENSDNYPLINRKQNRMPVADAGDNQTVLLGNTINLDGSGSYDLDEDKLFYNWEIISKPIGSIALLDDPLSPSPSVIPDLIGEYVFNLTVSDDYIASEPDTVGGKALQAPVIDSPNDITYEKGAINQNITWTPTDDNPYFYNVTKDGTLEDDGPWTGEKIAIDVKSLNVGIYIYVCTVYDEDGNNATDIVRVTVVDTISPNIFINNPTNITYSTKKIWLNFTIDEPTSWIGYSLDGTSNVTITGNFSLSSLTEGSHFVIVYANDSEGNIGQSALVWFTITIPPSPTMLTNTTSLSTSTVSSTSDLTTTPSTSSATSLSSTDSVSSISPGFSFIPLVLIAVLSLFAKRRRKLRR
jgi:parallel beta-helix repeat protein